jgi:hypothetical protein
MSLYVSMMVVDIRGGIAFMGNFFLMPLFPEKSIEQF